MSNPAESRSRRRHTHRREHGGDVWTDKDEGSASRLYLCKCIPKLESCHRVMSSDAAGSAIVILHIFDCKWYEYVWVWMVMSIFLVSRRRSGASSDIQPPWTHFIESFVSCRLFSNSGWGFLQSCTRFKSSLLTEWEDSGNVISTFNFLLF